jgi:HEPN domain-containing protein
MYQSKRYVYVAFMCQQSLEKLVKGLYNYYIDDNIPRVHNISFVYSKIIPSLNQETEEWVFELFDELSAYYIQGRYPTFKENISQLVDKNSAYELLESTKEVFKWLKFLKK